MTTDGPLGAEELDQLYEVSDEVAKHALAHYGNDEWLDVPFAQLMLSAARSLRNAGRNPSSAVVESMVRCTELHRAWADVWAEPEPTRMARALASAVGEIAEPLTDEAHTGPIWIKIGLGDIVKGITRRS